MNENYLYHWGILGMKWGIRRYQNPDGSLTSLGKRRRALARTFKMESSFDKKLSRLKADMEEAKATAILRGDTKTAYKYAEWFTNEELNKLVERNMTVSKLRKAEKQKIEKAKTFVSNTAGLLGSISTATANGISIYNNVAGTANMLGANLKKIDTGKKEDKNK